MAFSRKCPSTMAPLTGSSATSGAVRDRIVPPCRRVGKPRGTGFTTTGVSPRAIKYAHNPEIDDNRRAIVRADTPDSRSANRTTDRSPRCSARKSNTSAGLTSTGFFATTVKNVFRSNATARTVFGRARPATNSRYRSTNGSPSRYRTWPDATVERSKEGKPVMTAR